MPLLTSKNIWCPCLPHRLICNTFCCCFHLTSIARVNNNLRFFYFYFRLIPFFFVVLAIYLVFGLISVAWRGQQWNNKYEVRMLCTIWSVVALFWFPPSFFPASSSSWSRPGCCNTFETSQIPRVSHLKKNTEKKTKKKKKHQKHLYTKKSPALGLSQCP